jgi:hypothetical protein
MHLLAARTLRRRRLTALKTVGLVGHGGSLQTEVVLIQVLARPD